MSRLATLLAMTRKGGNVYVQSFIHLPREKLYFCLKCLKIKAFGE